MFTENIFKFIILLCISAYDNDVFKNYFNPRATSLCNEMHVDVFNDSYNRAPYNIVNNIKTRK
jgi:hypothetical protein